MENVTREAWLNQAAQELKPLYQEHKYAVPDNLHISCGFPSRSALSGKKQRIGECWSDEASDTKQFEIFISPVLADSVKVLDVLAHELVHAIVGHKAKHGAIFRKCAQAIGLEGKMTSTHAGDALKAKLEAIAAKLGAYPHGALHAMTNGKDKQSTRLLKCECPKCGYTVRVTKKWLDVGEPLCASGHGPMLPA